jgi:hypothetical protein
MSQPIKFTALLQEASAGTGGAFVLFPYDVMETFGSKGRIPIRATIHGEPYRGSLIRYGHLQHIFPVLKGIRKKLDKKIGDMVDITLEVDTEQREIEVPADLQQILKDYKLEKAFTKLSYTYRKEYVQWIEDA